MYDTRRVNVSFYLKNGRLSIDRHQMNKCQEREKKEKNHWIEQSRTVRLTLSHLSLPQNLNLLKAIKGECRWHSIWNRWVSDLFHRSLFRNCRTTTAELLILHRSLICRWIKLRQRWPFNDKFCRRSIAMIDGWLIGWCSIQWRIVRASIVDVSCLLSDLLSVPPISDLSLLFDKLLEFDASIGDRW